MKSDGAKIKSKSTYKYYKEGNIKEEVKHDGAQKITTTFKYDEKGNELERKWFNSNGRAPMGGIICKYDKKGNKLEEVHFGVNGKNFIEKTKYKYDKKGNLLETVTWKISIAKPLARAIM